MSTNWIDLFVKIFCIRKSIYKGVVKLDLSQAIRIRINDLISERELNVSKLSTLAGISRSTLSKFLSGKRQNLRIDIIEYICEALEIKLKDFFDDKVFDNIEMKD